MVERRRVASVGAVTSLRFVPLAPGIAEEITDWFDDEDMIQYLGGRDWLAASLRFERPVDVSASDVTAVHTWIVVAADHPVAVVRVAKLEEPVAIMELAVAPTRRRRGVGKKVLAALWDLPELAGVDELYGEVASGHTGALALAAAAGFERVEDGDDRVRLRRRRPAVAPRP